MPPGATSLRSTFCAAALRMFALGPVIMASTRPWVRSTRVSGAGPYSISMAMPCFLNSPQYGSIKYGM